MAKSTLRWTAKGELKSMPVTIPSFHILLTSPPWPLSMTNGSHTADSNGTTLRKGCDHFKIVPAIYCSLMVLQLLKPLGSSQPCLKYLETSFGIS